MKETYNHTEIEAKWQKVWLDGKIFRAPDDSAKKKYYVLDMFPYPSSAGLHVGHPLGYTATDIMSRYLRMNGYNVLHPMGWDAFGLPAENYAIKTKVHPEKSTLASITTFTRQIQSLGFSYDWDREVTTCLPDYYRWTQWFFSFLYKNGLAYRRKAPVNWCNSCNTVLANEQVENGKCERCKKDVIQKDLEQWFFRITDFIEDSGNTNGLLSGLDTIDWPESTKISQRNWIGKSEGAEVDFEIEGLDEKISVYTTRLDTIFSGTFLVVAPESPLVMRITTTDQKKDVEEYVKKTALKTELERLELEKEKTGAFTGSYALNPATGAKMPIWISDFVLAGYGSGAVFADAHDERDFEMAKKFGIPLKISLRPENDELWEKVKNLEVCYPDEGTLVNSGEFDGLTSAEARTKLCDWLGKKGMARPKVNYKLRDWLVSRQRYWGAPIPVVYDDDNNHYLLPDDELPVLLPHDVDFIPTGESPLRKSVSFHNPEDMKRIEEKLKSSGEMPKERHLTRRESDTMDTFVCSSWYMLRFMDPKNPAAFASKELMKKWGPVDLYVGGAEHTVLHLLYARFFTKALHRYGYLPYDEPFAKLRHQGMILAEDGQKMSKSLGNVINPDEVVEKYGADTLRCYEMFMGPFDQKKAWSMGGVEGVRKFLDRTYRVSLKPIVAEKPGDDILAVLHKTVKMVKEHIEELRFNTALSQMMILTNELTKLEKVPHSVLETFMLILSPFSPHLAEEIWNGALGHKDSIAFESWPEYDPKYLIEDEVTYAVQVNGKLRGELIIGRDAEKEEVLSRAKELENVKRHLEGKTIVKEVFVPGKIAGYVVK